MKDKYTKDEKRLEYIKRNEIQRIKKSLPQIADFIDVAIDAVIKNKDDIVSEIQNKKIIKIEDIPPGTIAYGEAIDLYTIVYNAVTEYLSDAVDGWFAVAIEQFKKLAIIEAERVSHSICKAYKDNKNKVVDKDLKDISYKSLFYSSKNSILPTEILKDKDKFEALKELIDERILQKTLNKD